MRMMTTFADRILGSIRRNLNKPTEAVAWFSLGVAALGLIIAVAGVAIAMASIYFQFFDKSHALSVVVSSYEIRDHEVTFGVVFNNQGDFTEVVTNGGIRLSKEKDSNISSGHYLESCFQPITVESRKAMHRYYTVQFPLADLLSKSSQTNELLHYISIYFGALSPRSNEVRTSLALGTITHNVTTGKVEKVSIPQNVSSFDFSTKNETKGLGSTFVPDNWKSDAHITCHQANAL